MTDKIKNKMKVVYSNVNIQDKINSLVQKIHRIVDDIAGPEQKEGKSRDLKPTP